jgi:geranylgeranylglycerol-phosphate geranylgeranyltransferase
MYSQSIRGLVIWKSRAYALCIRSRTEKRIIIFAWATLISILIATKAAPPLITAIAITFTSYMIALSVYIYNDVVDYEVDKINKLERPVAQGKVSRKDAATISLILAITGVVVSYLVNMEALLLTLLFLIIGFLYSIYLKSRGIYAKTLFPAILGGISGVLGGAAVGVLTPSVLYCGFLYFLLIFGTAPLMDLKDMKGDRLKGYKTLPLAYGPKFTVKIVMLTMASLIIITLASHSWIGFNIYTPILITSTALIMLTLFYTLLEKWQNPIYVQKMLRIAAGVNLLSYVALLIGIL